MLSRKEIRTAFDCCTQMPPKCLGCPYFELEPHECERQLYADALELRKGQKSVEPILVLDDGEHKLWQCGNCKVAVFTRDTKYCHNCGKAVKW